MPTPGEKALCASLEGKAVAVTSLVRRVAPREGPQIEPRVALTDGAEALPQPVRTHGPEHTLVLAIIQATKYLWDAANAVLGATPPYRTAWVRAYLEPRLRGQTDAGLTALAAEANDPTWAAPQRPAVRYGLKTQFGLDRMQALPALLFSHAALWT